MFIKAEQMTNPSGTFELKMVSMGLSAEVAPLGYKGATHISCALGLSSLWVNRYEHLITHYTTSLIVHIQI